MLRDVQQPLIQGLRDLQEEIESREKDSFVIIEAGEENGIAGLLFLPYKIEC